MHYLSNSKRSVLDDPLPVLEGPGGKVSNTLVMEVVRCRVDYNTCHYYSLCGF